MPGSVAGQGCLHLQGAQAGPQRIVVVGHRSPEDGQDSIPRELLERTAKADDRLAQQTQGVVYACPNLLRVQLVHQAGVPDQIGEQGAHDAPVAGRQPLGQRPQPSTAQVAKTRTRRGQRTAIGTGHRDLFGRPQYYPGRNPAKGRCRNRLDRAVQDAAIQRRPAVAATRARPDPEARAASRRR